MNHRFILNGMQIIFMVAERAAALNRNESRARLTLSERGVAGRRPDGEGIDAGGTREHGEALGRVQQVGGGLGPLEHDQVRE